MRICNLFDSARPTVSFEFFPPKNDEATEELFATVRKLKESAPSFVSVTYGAGGSTRRRTLELVARIKREIGIEPMAHLTCVGHSRDDIRRIVDALVAENIENVLALRGDTPKGQDEFVAAKDGFEFGSELVAFLREIGAPMCIGAACYPEKHPEATDAGLDLANLKTKVDAGVDFLITQLFFDNADYRDFVSRARASGIKLPIVPGIMPILNYGQIQRFTTMCGAGIPEALAEELSLVEDDLEAVAGVGISFAIDQCRELLAAGAPGLHFYTLNRSPATRAILSRLRHDRMRKP
ncbi:MAG: methylenetetrahydrofolate reductase [NAD(P)H] [Planctomycetes bacterium]|nr:methylenetetrahydrofolate reductase [NAD(P)H] [Planctomycetota bacterium]MCB9919537.1 methylenetetrahydrofolate reductase [NAD(P)H] [Planctomycetota bacterium]